MEIRLFVVYKNKCPVYCRLLKTYYGFNHDDLTENFGRKKLRGVLSGTIWECLNAKFLVRISPACFGNGIPYQRLQ